MRLLLPLLFSSIAASAALAAPALDQLRAAPQPVFRPGHSLIPLSIFGPEVSLPLRVELADHWGYCLYFGRLRPDLVKELDDPQSVTAQVCALAKRTPKQYSLQVIVAPSNSILTYLDKLPEATWTHDAAGQRAGDGRIWSTEAPDAAFEMVAEYEAAMLRAVLQAAPIAVVTNGGEYATPSLGHWQKHWEQDPVIQQARGQQDWWDYLSARKARQELIITRRLQALVPRRQLYIYYYTQGCTFRNRWGGWKDWCWDYRQIRPISDLPNAELYWSAGTDGWVGEHDLLTHVLNAVTQQLALGDRTSYNWLSPGWASSDAKEPAFSDADRYLGFLKCCYTTGMIGGVAGYFGYDSEDNWIWQLMALGQVQALFSHLDSFVRRSDLLPGPDMHRWSTDLPAYELPTNTDREVRVLARKHQKRAEWLLTAWDTKGMEKAVAVSVPGLGEVTLQARGSGSVYFAKLVRGRPELKLIDTDGAAPTKGMKAGWQLTP